MATNITQRSPGTWSFILELPADANGNRKQKRVTVKGTKADARREQTRLQREIDTGLFIEPSRITLGKYLEMWLSDYALMSVTPKTYEAYRNHLRSRVLPDLGHHLLPKLQPIHIQSAYTSWLSSGRQRGEGGLSPQTVLHLHRILHRALEQAVKWGLLGRNPCDAVEPPRPQRLEMKAIDEDRTALLLAAAQGTRLYLPILLAITTGMRRGEILGLRWQDVDLRQGKLSVNQSLEQTTGNLRFKQPKTARGRRSISLPSITVEALGRHKGEQAEHRLSIGPAYVDQGLVIAREDGSPVKPDRFSQDFLDLIRKHGLFRLRFHDLRHSHASQLFKADVHPKIVSERLGHSGIGITMDTYSHLLPGMQEVAAQKVDEALRRAIGG